MRDGNAETITPNQLFDESFSSTVSTSDEDESPLLGMAKLLKKNKSKKDSKSKKKDKKSKKSSSKKSSTGDKMKKNAQVDDSSEVLDATVSSLVEEESPGALKDLKEIWEQRSPQSSPRTIKTTSNDPGHRNVRSKLDLWEHRAAEKSHVVTDSPRPAPVVLTRDAKNDSSSYRRKIKRATTAPAKHNELYDALISLLFAAVLIGIAMLIHQPYGPRFENATFLSTMKNITAKWEFLPAFDDIVNYTQNYTEPAMEWMQQWRIYNVVTSTVDKWSTNGIEASKTPNTSGDIRHFLLL